jgi:hypothetical protein
MHLPTVWDLQCTGVVVSEVKSWLTRGASTVRAARADRRRPHGRLRRPDGRRRPSNRSTAYMAAAFGGVVRITSSSQLLELAHADAAGTCRTTAGTEWAVDGRRRPGFLVEFRRQAREGEVFYPSLITDSLYFNGSTCQWLLLFSARRLLHPSICVPFFCACGSRRRATTRGQCQIRVVVMSWREKKLHGD